MKSLKCRLFLVRRYEKSIERVSVLCGYRPKSSQSHLHHTDSHSVVKKNTSHLVCAASHLSAGIYTISIVDDALSPFVRLSLSLEPHYFAFVFFGVCMCVYGKLLKEVPHHIVCGMLREEMPRLRGLRHHTQHMCDTQPSSSSWNDRKAKRR